MRHTPRLLILFTWSVTVLWAEPARHEVSTRSVGATPFEKNLDRRLERFDTSGRTLVASVVDLSYKYQLPMALEYVDRDATTRSLNLQFHDESLRQILQAIIRQTPKYRVSFSRGLVDIFAPEARKDPLNLLNKVIKDFTVTQLDTHEADLELSCALGREAGSSGYSGGSIAVGQWQPLKITLHLKNAKAYEILNAIVAQNGKAIWTLMVRPENLSKIQSGGLWYVYPLQQPFKAVVLERLANMER
jgi:hypothetical protein